MGVIVYCVGLIKLPTIMSFIIQVIVGMIVYIWGSKILKIDSFEYLFDLVKKIAKGKKKRANENAK